MAKGDKNRVGHCPNFKAIVKTGSVIVVLVFLLVVVVVVVVQFDGMAVPPKKITLFRRANQ